MLITCSKIPDSRENKKTKFKHYSFLVFDSSCSKVGLDEIFKVKIVERYILVGVLSRLGVAM
jgi:hypothetical protein